MPDNVLLSHGTSHTTIGAKQFHFWVRYGIRWYLLANNDTTVLTVKCPTIDAASPINGANPPLTCLTSCFSSSLIIRISSSCLYNVPSIRGIYIPYLSFSNQMTANCLIAHANSPRATLTNSRVTPICGYINGGIDKSILGSHKKTPAAFATGVS